MHIRVRIVPALRPLFAISSASVLRDARELADCTPSVCERRNYTPSKQKAPGPARKTALTRRELEVLRLMATNMRNREIGVALCITQGTVKIHVHNILSKLGVNSRTGAIAKALIGHLV